jgi:SAM-dependent MidA family methyltransferase
MKSNKPITNQFDLSEEAQAITERLTDSVKVAVSKNDGFISFSDFMQKALYQPTLGYYQNNLQKFGEKGDFVTAPEMGQAFAYSLANSIEAYLAESDIATVMEIGAGSGILAVNLIKALSDRNLVPHHYYILEPSSQLQNQQRQLIEKEIPRYSDRVIWLNGLPERFEGVIIANEVLDAIPCERVVLNEGKWCNIGIGISDSELVEQVVPLSDKTDLPKELNQTESFPEGYTAEFRPLVDGWIKALAASLKSGAILLIDYGYSEAELYHPQRVEGTLTCFVRHHAHHDPLYLIGLQDITAHVNFTQVAKAADNNGLLVQGFTTQAGFLLENGITEFNQEKATQLSEKQRYRLSQELQLLLMPGQMGEVIKVILLTKPETLTVKGFELQDHIHRL